MPSSAFSRSRASMPSFGLEDDADSEAGVWKDGMRRFWKNGIVPAHTVLAHDSLRVLLQLDEKIDTSILPWVTVPPAGLIQRVRVEQLETRCSPVSVSNPAHQVQPRLRSAPFKHHIIQ